MDERAEEVPCGDVVSELKRYLAAVKDHAQQGVSAGWDASVDSEGELSALLRDVRAMAGMLLRQVSGPPLLSPGPVSDLDIELAFEELQLAEEELRVQNDELLQTQQAVNAERQRYQELFDFAPDGYLVTDFSGVVQEANRAAANLLGVDRCFLVGKPLSLFVDSEEQEQLRRNLEMLRRDDAGQSLRWETSMHSLEGAPFAAGLAVAPVGGAGGALIGLRWLIRDVTERVRAEEMLRHQADELRQLTEHLEQRVQGRTAELASAYAELQTEMVDRKRAEALARNERQRFNDILEILPAYVVLLTPDYHVPVANRVFRERFGEAHGRRCYEYLFGRDEPCETCETYTVLKTGERHQWNWIGPDGRNYDVCDFPFVDSDGSTLILEMGIDVTERVQAERALQEANEMLERRVAERTAALTHSNAELAETRDYLEKLLTYANAPIAVWDPALRITRFNTAFERITGRAASSVVGQTLDILFPEEQKEEAMVQIQRATTGERWEAVEIPILHVDGTVRTVLWNSATVYEADGVTPLATIAQGHDISERKRAEEELRQREEQLRVITDSVPVLIAYVDREERYRFANKQYEAWFGQPPQEIVGKHLEDLLGSEAYPIVRPYMQRALEGDAVRFEQWVPYQGAGLRYVDSAYVPSRDGEGRVQGYYVLVSDQTERERAAQDRERLLEEVRQARDEMERRVEERTADLLGINEVLQAEIAMRRQKEEELRESELRFRQLAENIDEAFWLLEPDSGRFLYVNPMWQELWGRSGEDVRGWPALFEAAAHPEDREQLIAAWQAEGARFDREFRILETDGEVRWVRGRAFPVQDSEGQCRRVAGIIQDITAEKDAQAALIQAERMSTAGRLAASLGHEINNPLQSAIGCLDLAREAMDEGRDPSRFLEVSCEALERAAWVVSQLRSLHRDALREESRQVNLHDLLHDVLLLSRKQCASQGIQVYEEFGDDLPPLSLMPNALQQVFLNLVLNAIDAMPEGGDLRVSLEPTVEPEGVWIRFADTGRGLSDEVREHLFEPFHTTKSEGLGLGLFISHGIVQKHSGRIEAQPGEEGGTVFSVWLPRS
ncbi:MAG: PAS domain S-box protein [Anaerolineae bacterium]|nr:PAS domain S-box protein [Anaerolineae bacterium]